MFSFTFQMQHIYNSTVESLHSYQSKLNIISSLQTLLSDVCQSLYIHPLESHEKVLWFQPFGSFKFGVSSVSSDIDICVFGRYSRSFLFDVVAPELQRKHILSLVIINDPKLSVPILKCQFQNTQIDLSYCYLKSAFTEFPTDCKDVISYIHPESYHDVSSLSGVVNGCIIANLIDTLGERSKQMIVCIKHWAQVHGVYSNKLGFLGGISWTVLVLYFCRIFSRNNESLWLTSSLETCIKYFFIFCLKFKWKEHAIDLDETREKEIVSTYVTSLMNIFTESYQQGSWKRWNSCYNVYQRSFELLHEAWAKSLQNLYTEQSIMCVDTFVSENRLCIEASCKEHPSYIHKLEAKLKHLFMDLQQIPDLFIYPSSNYYQMKSEYSCKYSLPIEYNKQTLDLTEVIAKFKKLMFEGIDYLMKIELSIKLERSC